MTSQERGEGLLYRVSSQRDRSGTGRGRGQRLAQLPERILPADERGRHVTQPRLMISFSLPPGMPATGTGGAAAGRAGSGEVSTASATRAATEPASSGSFFLCHRRPSPIRRY